MPSFANNALCSKFTSTKLLTDWRQPTVSHSRVPSISSHLMRCAIQFPARKVTSADGNKFSQINHLRFNCERKMFVTRVNGNQITFRRRETFFFKQKIVCFYTRWRHRMLSSQRFCLLAIWNISVQLVLVVLRQWHFHSVIECFGGTIVHDNNDSIPLLVEQIVSLGLSMANLVENFQSHSSTRDSELWEMKKKTDNETNTPNSNARRMRIL